MTISKQVVFLKLYNLILTMSFRANVDKFRFMFSYFKQYCMWAMMIANGSVRKLKLKRAIE